MKSPATGPILVINPNSSRSVTEGLSEALEPFRIPGGPAIDCVDIPESPPGIMTQRDVDTAGLRVAALAGSRPDAAAIVIACYSDPGIDVTRESVSVPVYGIQEAGILTALSRAEKIGVAAIADGSIPRHLRYLRKIGLEHRLAGEIALNGPSVAESGHGAENLARLVQVGEALRAQGAGAIVLGCAGMARQRAAAEAALGIPVIDPTQAAVAMALGQILAARA